jgi:hypothetical protein
MKNLARTATAPASRYVRLATRQGVCTLAGLTILIGILLTTGFTRRVHAETIPIAIMGDDPTNGIFDPSVEYGAAMSDGWLAYSAVFGSLMPWGPHVETHIARSLNGGSSWTYETVAVPSTINPLVNFDATLDAAHRIGETRRSFRIEGNSMTLVPHRHHRVALRCIKIGLL